MRIGRATVTESREVYPHTFVLWLSAPVVIKGAVPGQFVMVRCGEGADPLLPRALSIYRVRDTEDGREFALLYDVVGRGTEWLSCRQAGDSVELYGPLGHGYTVRPDSRNLLLVGGGIGVAPLVWLADEAAERGLSVTMLLGARNADQIYPVSLLHPEVELVVATDDGSSGHKGFVTDLVTSYTTWADQIFTCGPTPMFRALANTLRAAQFRKSCQALLEERMACGTGICYSCAVETRRHGMKLICKDGPKFELRDVY